MQDIFIYQSSQLLHENIYDKLKRAGFPKGIDLPLTLMNKIARETHDDYFLTGNLTKENTTFTISTKLYDTKSGKMISKSQFTSTDAISLVDDISIKIKQDLKIPDYHIDAIQDLPVTEFISNNTEAYKHFIEGNQKLSYDNDYQQASSDLQKAIKTAPAFAIAYFFLGVVYANDNLSNKSVASLKKAMKFDYKLPQHMKFQTKDTYYIMTGQATKRLNLVKMQTKLCPESLQAYLTLADIYTRSGELNEAITIFEKLRTWAPEPDLYLDEIGLLYLQLNDTDKALKYIKNYADIYHADPEAFNQLAMIYRVTGQDDLVVKNYEKTLFLDQTNMTAMLNLASLDNKIWTF